MGEEERCPQVRAGDRGWKGAGESHEPCGQEAWQRVKAPRYRGVIGSEWFSQSRRCICRSACRPPGAEQSRRGKHPRKECLAGSHHRPEGHRSHSAGRGKERSNEYAHARAATGGSEVVMGREGSELGMKWGGKWWSWTWITVVGLSSENEDVMELRF